MYSDLLDVLGGGNALNANNSARREPEKHVVASFKAGKMNMERKENGKYWVTPDTRRGLVQLVWQDSSLKWEWLSRRENTVVDSHTVSTTAATFERVPDTPTGRIYLLSEPRTMYWMQDASDEKDDEVVAQVNQYLANPQDAAPEGTTTTQAAAASAAESSGTTSNQVDALSNILENLVMPQQQQQTTTSTTPTGTLTLADLQGAMANLGGTTTPPGPPLQEVVTSDAISELLKDDAVKQRLLEFLPESQRSLENLQDNLRSPMILSTLRNITAALQPDEMGNMEGYHSLLANFQLDPQAGQQALTEGNPIQAFLDCVLASVQKEEEETKEEESKEEEETKDEDAMQE